MMQDGCSHGVSYTDCCLICEILYAEQMVRFYRMKLTDYLKRLQDLQDEQARAFSRNATSNAEVAAGRRAIDAAERATSPATRGRKLGRIRDDDGEGV